MQLEQAGVVRRRRGRVALQLDVAGARLGFGRIVASEIEAPNMLTNIFVLYKVSALLVKVAPRGGRIISPRARKNPKVHYFTQDKDMVWRG